MSRFWHGLGGVLRSLKGTISQPFLVRESEAGQKPEWYLYAVSPRTLVQVLTVKRSRARGAPWTALWPTSNVTLASYLP